MVGDDEDEEQPYCLARLRGYVRSGDISKDSQVEEQDLIPLSDEDLQLIQENQ